MVVALHTLTGVLYLVACLASGAGLALGSARAMRVAVVALAAGALAHGLTFSLLHTVNPPPPLTDLTWAASLMSWIAVLAYLALLRRTKVSGLVVLVAPMAFLGVFLAALRLPGPVEATTAGSASLAHAHVLLASAGFALLGLAGLCGALFLAEHRRLKRRQALPGSGLPSLESLDRAGAVALAIGFPLLTLGVVTGAMWVHAARESWNGNAHEIGALVAWCLYLLLVLQRFAVHQGARRCAISALAGFALLSVWVVGVEVLA